MKCKTIFLVFFISFWIFLSNVHAGLLPNVWDVLRGELSLDHEVMRPEVQIQIRWLLSHPNYLHNLASSEPYIYHIVTEIRKRHLPGEMALLPMIESAFNPFAYSVVGAAGLWQFMPDTGSQWGLKQDWWFDARRSVSSSTDAALNYLAHLNKYFNGNWILAIASYDAGEGSVSRAIKNSGQNPNSIDFWTLPLPNETKAYVPRLLALAEIIKYPERYKITLPDIPHTPYFEEVNIGSQIDLNHAAELAGMSYTDLIKLNPGCNRWATAPYKPFKLLIPSDKVAHFNRNLSQVPHEKRVSWQQHKVVAGDNLDSIAQHYFTTVNLIRELNQLKSEHLKRGQLLLLPSTKNTPVTREHKPIMLIADKPITTKIYKVLHIVQPNENIQLLEKKYQVSAAKIRIWNKLASTDILKKGDQLIIWKNDTSSKG